MSNLGDVWESVCPLYGRSVNATTLSYLDSLIAERVSGFYEVKAVVDGINCKRKNCKRL